MGESVPKYRVEVRGQYKGAVAYKRGAASPWQWHKVARLSSGEYRATGAVESFRRIADVAPWIARACRVESWAVKLLTRAQYMRRSSRSA